MKAIVITSMILFGATGAIANEAADELANRQQLAGQLTRAQVQAEYGQARRDGALPVTSEAAAMGPQAEPVHARSRDAVRKEAAAAARTRTVHERM